MNQLGICTVSPYVSIAVMNGETILAETGFATGLIDDLVVRVETTLALAGISQHDIGELVVVNGPGSYSGIRAGISFVKTLALVHHLPVRQVNTLAMLAYPYLSYDGLIVVLTQARKDEANLGLFGGGRAALNVLMSGETLSLKQVWNKLASIQAPYILVTDQTEVPLPIARVVAPTYSAVNAIRLAAGIKATPLVKVAPFYAYPVHITKKENAGD